MRSTIRASGFRPRPKAVPSVSSYVASPSTIQVGVAALGKKNGTRPNTLRAAPGMPRASSRWTTWASSWVST
jgi:hypothetical protein